LKKGFSKQIGFVSTYHRLTGVEGHPMRDHIRILGILNIVMGALTALIGVILVVILAGTAGLIGAGLTGDYENGQVAAPILAFVGLCFGVFFLILALPSIIGGWGLMNLKPWARILMIVISILHLFNVPIGTALGVYGLWVLLSDEARRIFERPAQAYVPPAPYPAQTNQSDPATSRPQPPPGV
jgi:hypothetical protein